MSPKRIPRYAAAWVKDHGGLVSVIVVTYLCLGITVVVALTALDVGRTSRDSARAVCKGQNDIRAQLQALIAASDAQLGKPGTVGSSYYRSHPDELAAAHRANRETLAQFAPLSCEN